MSFFTLGLYEIYWFYQNWCFERYHEKSDIKTMVRAVMSLVFCYPLLKKMKKALAARSQALSFSPFLLTLGWTCLTLMGNLPDRLWLVGNLSGLFLLPVQKRVNLLHEMAGMDAAKANDRLTPANYVVLAIGIIAMAALLAYDA